jgi:hypothetical protein
LRDRRQAGPAGQHAQHDLQRRGVDHESELISRAGLRDISRVVEHYGHFYSSTPAFFLA